MSLLQSYVAAGIIQFGRFKNSDGDFDPLDINFRLLPSYPDAMQASARALVPLLDIHSDHDRLLATRDSIPLGALLSVEADIPLTYPYGEAQAHTNAYVIEGAFDIGHRTTLLSYVVGDAEDVKILLEPAAKVGLNIEEVICLFTLGQRGEKTLQDRGIVVKRLFNFSDELEKLESTHTLPAPMRRYVEEWLATK